MMSGNITDTATTKNNDDRSPPPSLADLSLSNSSSSSTTSIASIASSIKESEPLCEGDTKVIYDVLPPPLCDDIFDRVRDEVRWQRMSHQGGEVPRLVAVQGDIHKNLDDESNSSSNNIPIYRHPADETPPLRPFTATVEAIKGAVEARVGHALNHVLIQLYRDGTDYISEHSDKTLDIARDSYIVNVSLGAARTMVLRTKRKPKWREEGKNQPKANGNAGAGADVTTSPVPEPTTGTTKASEKDLLKRQTQRTLLPHNSLFQMGLATNRHWLHGIRQDRRADRDKSAEELAYGGGRISLTFRLIATFLTRRGDCDEDDDDDDSENSDDGDGDGESERQAKGNGKGKNEYLIWGQGATSKTRAGARPVINGATPPAIAMLRAFGRENQLAGGFDWDEAYGAGFDVLNISASPRLFLSGDAVVNMRVQLMLAEFGVGYARGSLAAGGGGGGGEEEGEKKGKDEGENIKLVDNDSDKTTVKGGRAIMEYVDRVYGRKNKADSTATTTGDDDEDGLLAAQQKKESVCFQQALDLLHKYRTTVLTSPSSDPYDNDDDDDEDDDETKDKKKDLLISDLLKPWVAYAAAAAAALESQGQGQGQGQGQVFIAGGSSMTLADFALWPVLHNIVVSGSPATPSARRFLVDDGNTGVLLKYYERVKARDATKRVLVAPGATEAVSP